MPSVLVYEYLTALGIGQDPASEWHGMYREGLAMAEAIAHDLGDLADTTVHRFRCEKSQEKSAFLEACSAVDSVFLIAPEIDGILIERATWLAEAGIPSWGPTVDAIRLCSDKLELARRLSEAGVPTPATRLASEWDRDSPVILKDRFGAGSSWVRFCPGISAFREQEKQAIAAGIGELLAQEPVAGQPASIAFLVGPGEAVPLLPATQILSDDGRYEYRGGELPLPPEWAERAKTLGKQAISAVAGLRGYVGVDLILGENAGNDQIIEINPRLTTSYIGLRALCKGNLVKVLQKVLKNQGEMQLDWNPGGIRFDCWGKTMMTITRENLVD